MASMRDIKRRKGSIQSTQQITKAMKLVSTVKLQRAKQRAEDSKSYFDLMYDTVTSVLARTSGLEHPYLNGGTSDKKAVIAITSNRGLAGGYNSNIVKMIRDNGFTKDNSVIYAIGKKGRDALARGGYEIAIDGNEVMEAPTYEDAIAISKEVLQAFTDGKVGEIYLAYTRFKNTVVHEPRMLKLLPVEIPEETADKEQGAKAVMSFEPSDEEALNMIIPKYMTSLIYGGLIEAVASENGARMQAMDSATSNAEDMINQLSLQYNRARQGAITQELTEIIAGANAIS